MITDKKTTLPFACNFFVNSLLNFKFNDLMLTRLLATIEKKLNQKNNIDFSKTNSYFNSKLIYNISDKDDFFQNNDKYVITEDR
jgi:hypothetical protein